MGATTPHSCSVWFGLVSCGFENGMIVKIYKSLVDPILVGGACAPKLRWASPQDL